MWQKNLPLLSAILLVRILRARTSALRDVLTGKKSIGHDSRKSKERIFYLIHEETSMMCLIQSTTCLQVRKIPVQLLTQVENALLIGVLAAGGLWVTAGLGTAYDAYMIATKQPVPPGVDEALSKYVEPFLTPGLAAILIFSIMLGGLQVYKFEGGRKKL
jgi:hypothetical protein